MPSDKDILSDEQIAEIEALYPFSPSVKALCQTALFLREKAFLPKILPDDPVVTYQDDNARLLREKLTQQAEVRGVLDALGDNCVHVCEEGGPEDIFASLAVSIAKLQSRLAEVERERDRLCTELAERDKGAGLVAEALSNEVNRRID